MRTRNVELIKKSNFLQFHAILWQIIQITIYNYGAAHEVCHALEGRGYEKV